VSILTYTRIFASMLTLAVAEPSALASSDIGLSDGNALLRLCEAALNPHMSRSDLLNRMYLMGYVQGFTEARPSAAEYDIPPGVTLEQAVRIIKKWLEDHPKMLDKPAHSLILLALRDAYPAKGQ
jgi:Rap1a immunity proteins